MGWICARVPTDMPARNCRLRSGRQAAGQNQGAIMNSASVSTRTTRRPVIVFALIIGLALTGCQTAVPGPAPAVQPAPAAPHAPVGVDTNRPADRVAEEIERNADRMAELSKRFAGVPADRVEEQLRREAVAAGGVQ